MFFSKWLYESVFKHKSHQIRESFSIGFVHHIKARFQELLHTFFHPMAAVRSQTSLYIHSSAGTSEVGIHPRELVENCQTANRLNNKNTDKDLLQRDQMDSAAGVPPALEPCSPLSLPARECLPSYFSSVGFAVPLFGPWRAPYCL